MERSLKQFNAKSGVWKFEMLIEDELRKNKLVAERKLETSQPIGIKPTTKDFKFDLDMYFKGCLIHFFFIKHI